MSVNALHESIRTFLAKKGFIKEESLQTPGLTPEDELAYKSFAQHRLGAPYPWDLPANIFQVPAAILDDADWVYLDHLEESDDNVPAVDDEGDEEESTDSEVNNTQVQVPASAPAPEPASEPVSELPPPAPEPEQLQTPAPEADGQPESQGNTETGESNSEGSDSDAKAEESNSESSEPPAGQPSDTSSPE